MTRSAKEPTSERRVVALLRGVNIGKRRLAMATLRSGLEAAGALDVVTYIQSGNVILTPPAAALDVTSWLETMISEIAGFAVPVVTRTAEDLRGVVQRNPFPDTGGTALHVLFTQTRAAAELLDQLELARFVPEQAAASGQEIYFSLPNGMATSMTPAAVEKLANRKPITVTTTRNWNTVEELLRLMEA